MCDMAQHYMGETDYGRQRLRQNLALLDIQADGRAETGGEVGMMEMIIGNIIAIIVVISIFWFGYEVGKFKGLLKAEKMFNEAIDKAVNRNE